MWIWLKLVDGALQTRWYFLTVELRIYTASGITYRVVPGAVLAASPRDLLGMPVLTGLNQKLQGTSPPGDSDGP